MRALMASLGAAILLAAALTPAAAQVQPPQPAPPTAGGIIVRSGDNAVLDGAGAEMGFVAGGHVRVTAQVTDDIFASGGELRVEGAGADHLFLAGGQIEATPGMVHDVIAAGGRIRLNAGTVSDDVVMAGGNLSLEPAARIDGSAVLAGGQLHVQTPIARHLRAAGGRVEVNGPVGGDVDIWAGEAVIGPAARIGGNLHVRAQSIEIAPGAMVQGSTTREIVKHERGPGGAIVGFLFAAGALLVEGLIAAFAPGLMAGVDRDLRTRFWVMAGVGALIALLAPVVLAILFATVIGAPLALVLLFALLLAAPLAFAAVSYWIGQWLRRRLARRPPDAVPDWRARFGWTLLAALLLMIVCAIPFIGGLIWLLALFAGLGAVAAQLLPTVGRARRV